MELLYKGKLGTRVMSGLPKKAYTSYRAQKYRCSNKNAIDYKYYGAKGICVEYSSRDYVNWWLSQRKNFHKSAVVSIDRIDHSKNYSFANVRMVLHRDNVIECNRRTHCKGVRVFKNGCFIKEVKTVKEAHAISGVAVYRIFWSRKRGTLLKKLKKDGKDTWHFKFGLDPQAHSNTIKRAKKSGDSI